MNRSEPQITEIASYLAATLPNEGAPKEEAVQAWRKTLRYARKAGAIDGITTMLRSDSEGDTQIERYCDELAG